MEYKTGTCPDQEWSLRWADGGVSMSTGTWHALLKIEEHVLKIELGYTMRLD
jgi:hypothetical protein